MKTHYKNGQILIELLFLICLLCGFLTCILLLQENVERETRNKRLHGTHTKRSWKR